MAFSDYEQKSVSGKTEAEALAKADKLVQQGWTIMARVIKPDGQTRVDLWRKKPEIDKKQQR